MLRRRRRIVRGCSVVLFALLALSAAYAQAGDPVGAAFDQGRAAFKAGKYGDAITSLKKALAIDPDYTMAKLYLGASYAMQVQPNVKTRENLANAEAALVALRQIPEEDEGYHNALKLMSLVYRNTGKLDDAREMELSALKIDPDDAESHYTIGVINWRAATEFAASALAADGQTDDGAGNARMSADTCSKIKTHNEQLVDDAITHLTRALELRANYADAMGYLKLVYLRRADFDCDDPGARAQDIELANRWGKQADVAKSAPASH